MKNCCAVDILKSVYRKVLSICLLIKWQYQTFYLRNNIAQHSVLTNELKGKFLILAPHSDDEWIGCGQLIEDQSLDVVICNMDMPGGDSPSLHVMRREEMGNVANEYSREIITLNQNKVESLTELIKNLKPKYICLPFIIDWHSEHREVMGILENALVHCNEIGSEVIMYQVSVPIPVAYVNYVKTLSRSKWINKWKYFRKYYPTQTYIPYKRFALNERVNGEINGEYAAEVYSIMPISEWTVCFRNSFQRQEEIRNLVKMLPDMVEIRKKTEMLCNQMFNK